MRGWWCSSPVTQFAGWLSSGTHGHPRTFCQSTAVKALIDKSFLLFHTLVPQSHIDLSRSIELFYNAIFTHLSFWLRLLTGLRGSAATFCHTADCLTPPHHFCETVLIALGFSCFGEPTGMSFLMAILHTPPKKCLSAFLSAAGTQCVCVCVSPAMLFLLLN